VCTSSLGISVPDFGMLQFLLFSVAVTKYTNDSMEILQCNAMD
jgi:hypothetical protein